MGSDEKRSGPKRWTRSEASPLPDADAMMVRINLTAEPIPPGRLPPELAGAAGALVEFQGVVRGEEDQRLIAALEYEAYSPMAEMVMREIVDDLGQQHPCLFVGVTHRVGLVPTGEAAIHMLAAAEHRTEALAMVTAFMDRLKQDVPIWKRRALNHEEFAARKQP
jgi:molybdopterin synthase catalytic subunit